MGFSREEKIKVVCVSAFATIVAASIGGGLYFFGIAQLNVLFEFSITISVGFLITSGIGSIYMGRKYRGVVIGIKDRVDSRLIALTEKFGKGFTDLDIEIIEAMNKGKTTIKDIAVFLNEKEKTVRERIDFMKKKGVLQDE